LSLFLFVQLYEAKIVFDLTQNEGI
jgi:hypothetical protein